MQNGMVELNKMLENA